MPWGRQTGKCLTMAEFEYKVVTAPKKTKAFKGVRSHEDLFAHVLMEVMNDLALHDWEYLRAESLPCEEKSGLVSRVESYQSVLVFRRKIVANQNFFELPPTHQIELHEVKEDITEIEMPVSQNTRPSLVSDNDHVADVPETEAGVLSILRTRKARLVKEDMETYPEHMKLAGE